MLLLSLSEGGVEWGSRDDRRKTRASSSWSLTLQHNSTIPYRRASYHCCATPTPFSPLFPIPKNVTASLKRLEDNRQRLQSDVNAVHETLQGRMGRLETESEMERSKARAATASNGGNSADYLVDWIAMHFMISRFFFLLLSSLCVHGSMRQGLGRRVGNFIVDAAVETPLGVWGDGENFLSACFRHLY